MESFGVKLTWLGFKHLNFVRPSLLFTIPTGTDRRTRNRCSKHRWSYSSHAYSRAPKYKCW